MPPHGPRRAPLRVLPLAALLVLLPALLPGASAGGASTFYVATTGSDSNDGRTLGNAFATVTRALDEVETEQNPDAALILVSAGTYVEPGSTPKVGYPFNITGASAETTFISASGQLFRSTADPGDLVKLANVTFTGFTTTAFAMTSQATLRIEDCVFSDNPTVEDVLVASSAESTVITGTTFWNGTYAVLAQGGELVLDQVTVAHHEGTPVIFNGTTLDIVGGYFANNVNAADDGGVVVVRGATGVTISSGTWAGNVASVGSGGAIFFNRGEYPIELTGTTFANNTAATGGALSVATPSLSAILCTFDTNRATVETGGGIHIAYTDTVAPSVAVVLDRTTFTGNTATQHGGAVHAESSSTDLVELTVMQCTLSANEAGIRGGAVHARNGPVVITGTTFSGNSAPGTSSTVFGGAVSLNEFHFPMTNGTSLVVVDTVFENNRCDNVGTAVSIQPDVTVQFDANFTRVDFVGNTGDTSTLHTAVPTTLQDCTFVGNTAESPAAIYIGRAGSWQGPVAAVTISGSTFRDNTGSIYDYGVILFDPDESSKSTLTVEDSLFENNIGGSIEMRESLSELTVTNCTFQHNRAESGPMVYSSASSVTVTIQSSTCINGTALEAGGCVYHSGSQLTISNSTFQSSTAALYGGGVFTIDPATISDSVFDGNSAGLGGSGIFADAELDLVDVLVTRHTDNSAVRVISTTTVTRCTFTDNTHNDKGGALFGIPGGDVLTVTNSTFARNSAVYGGALFSGVDDLTVTGSTFTNNTAQNGGAVYGQLSNLDFTDCTLSGNSQTDQANYEVDGGGAVSILRGSLTMRTCTLVDNHATSFGGAINGWLASDGTVLLQDCSITENSADLSGGGLAAFGRFSETLISHYGISGMTAYDEELYYYYYEYYGERSGVRFDGTADGQIQIFNTALSGNTAADHGDSVYVDGSIKVSGAGVFMSEMYVETYDLYAVVGGLDHDFVESYLGTVTLIDDASSVLCTRRSGTVDTAVTGASTATEVGCLADWESATVSGAMVPALAHMAVAAYINDSVLVHGGALQDGTYGDSTYILNTTTTTWTLVTAEPDTARWMHGMVVDAAGVPVMLWGEKSGEVLDDVLEFQGSWLPMAVTGAVTPRFGFAHALVDERLFVFGGRSQTSFSTSMLDELHLVNKTWASAASGPPARSFATMVASDGMLYLFGGLDSLGDARGDFWRYEVATGSWTELSPSGTTSAPARGMHGAAMFGGFMYVTGGIAAPGDATGSLRTYFYSVADNQWYCEADGAEIVNQHGGAAFALAVDKMVRIGGHDHGVGVYLEGVYEFVPVSTLVVGVEFAGGVGE